MARVKALKRLRPAFLVLVHGHVGVAQQVGRGFGVQGAQGYAQAGGELYFVAGDGEGLA
jgi:hypothetical protein